MACPLVQQVFEHAFRDCGSFQKDGAEGSKAVCLEPCLGRQEPLHQLTERGTPSLFSDNFNLTTMIQKLDGSMETKPTLWVSLQSLRCSFSEGPQSSCQWHSQAPQTLIGSKGSLLTVLPFKLRPVKLVQSQCSRDESAANIVRAIARVTIGRDGTN